MSKIKAAAVLKVAIEIRDRSNSIVSGVTGNRSWLRAQPDALDKVLAEQVQQRVKKPRRRK
jgi:hypothetical protein